MFLSKIVSKRKHKPSQFEAPRGFHRLSAGVSITEDSCMEASAFYSGVIYVSTQIAKIPWQVKDRNNKVLWDDPVNILLNVCPNDWMSAFNFKLTMIQMAIVKGNAYAEIERDMLGRPKKLHLLKSEDVEPYLTPNGDLVYRILGGSIVQYGSDAYLLPKDIFHLRNFHSKDGVVGQGVIAYATETLGISIGADRFANKLFANGGMPSGVISVTGTLDDEGIERMKKSWHDAHGGRKVGGTAVLEDGAKYEPISHDPQVLQFLESRKFSVQEIGRYLRVPPQKLYDTSAQTYSNAEQASLEVVTDTLDPWTRNLESEADIKLLNKQKGGKRTEFDITAIFRADMETRGKYYNDLMQSAAITPNEIRISEGRESYEGGDKFYIASNNFSPVDRLDEIIDSQINSKNVSSDANALEAAATAEVVNILKRK